MNRYENMVNFTTVSTSAVNQIYQTPTPDTDSLSFKMKNNIMIAYSFKVVFPLNNSDEPGKIDVPLSKE